MKALFDILFTIWGLACFVCFLLSPIVLVGLLILFLMGQP